MYNLRCVPESEIDDDYRALVGEWLAAAHPSLAHLFRGRAWWTLPPLFRCVAETGGAVAGQVSAFAVESRPALRVLGLGDAILKHEHRGRGLFREIMRSAVAECWRRDAEVIITSTKKHSPTILSLGFFPARPFQFYYEQDSACLWRPTWLVIFRGDEPRRRLRLAEGLF